MKKINISVVISAYNEEKMLEACLNSVNFADEIIVVDNESEDQTSSIAKKYTKKIFTVANKKMLNINKNFGFSKATHEWVLSLDADERVTDTLAKEIETILANPQANGYWIPRKNIIFGKWIQSAMWWPDYQLRLFKKTKGKFPEKHVHEYLEVEGITGKLQEPFMHENYTSISQFIKKMDTIYTESEVEKYLHENKAVTIKNVIAFPHNDFLKTFFLQKGYKDGLHGLILSQLQAFYSFVSLAKLWERKGFTQNQNDNFTDEVYANLENAHSHMRYWYLTYRIENEKNPVRKSLYKLQRKRIAQRIT